MLETSLSLKLVLHSMADLGQYQLAQPVNLVAGLNQIPALENVPKWPSPRAAPDLCSRICDQMPSVM